MQFDEDTGDVTVTDTSPVVKCATDNSFPPLPWICTSFEPRAGPARAHDVDRGRRAADPRRRPLVEHGRPRAHARPHAPPRLVLRLRRRLQRAARVPLPGRDRVRTRAMPDSVAGPLPALEPIFSRDATVHRVGGAVVIPGQRADGARFFGPDEFGIDYHGPHDPGGGHADAHPLLRDRERRRRRVEDGADRLRAWIGAAARAGRRPRRAGGSGTADAVARTPARPSLSRRGRVRVRRAGRTFVVTTRDRVRCPAGCALRISGRRVAHVRASGWAPVAAPPSGFRLTRAGARALSRRGRLRLTVTISARAGRRSGGDEAADPDDPAALEAAQAAGVGRSSGSTSGGRPRTCSFMSESQPPAVIATVAARASPGADVDLERVGPGLVDRSGTARAGRRSSRAWP